ncbi:MAG: hypothetical protein IJL69_05525, partial [Oscillospiraceae bacterium]|nr:hypothetical protein [Oscillospiraceae bacterium]
QAALLAHVGARTGRAADGSWTEESAGGGTTLTVDLGDAMATWSAESVGAASGAVRIGAAFTEKPGALCAVEVGGLSDGSWRVRSDAFGGLTGVCAVMLTSGGHSIYAAGVSDGFAEFASRGVSGTFEFYTEEGLPEEYRGGPAATETSAPATETGSSGPKRPGRPGEPQKGVVLMVAVCAAAVSAAGAFLYALLSSAPGKKKKKLSSIREPRFRKY